MCIHRELTTTHTAYGFYDIKQELCVFCIWNKFSAKEVTQISLDKFEEGPFWDDYKINQEFHNKRILEADLSYPIFISEEEYDNQIMYNIIDGCHRVIKARQDRLKTINSIILSYEDCMSCLF